MTLSTYVVIKCFTPALPPVTHQAARRQRHSGYKRGMRADMDAAVTRDWEHIDNHEPRDDTHDTSDLD